MRTLRPQHFNEEKYKNLMAHVEARGPMCAPVPETCLSDLWCVSRRDPPLNRHTRRHQPRNTGSLRNHKARNETEQDEHEWRRVFVIEGPDTASGVTW